MCKSAVTFGDPLFERSALANFKPWQPVYDDRPIQTQPKEVVDLCVPQTVIYRALREACQITGADFRSVIVGAIDPSKGIRFNSRARLLSMIALKNVYPNANHRHLALELGMRKSTAQSYWAQIRVRLREGSVKWLTDQMVDRVVGAIDAFR